jgi:ABC-type phosphate/phosphonate transport system substrate-binding protein
MLLFGSSINYSGSEKTKFRLQMGYSISSFQDIEAIDVSAAVSVYVNMFRDRVQKRLKKDIAFDSKIYNSIKEMSNALNNKEVDLLSISVYEYYLLNKLADITPCLTVTNNEEAAEQYCILTRNDLSIKKFSDLIGKILSVPTFKNHPMLEEWLFNLLAKNKLSEINKTFRKVIFNDKESNAVYDVFFKKSDLAIVRKSVYDVLCGLNPQLKNLLAVFAVSKPMILSFTVSNNKSNPEIIKIVIDEARSLHITPGGKNILNIFKAKKTVKIDEADLKYSKEIMDENSLYRRQNSLPKNTRANNG